MLYLPMHLKIHTTYKGKQSHRSSPAPRPQLAPAFVFTFHALLAGKAGASSPFLHFHPLHRGCPLTPCVGTRMPGHSPWGRWGTRPLCPVASGLFSYPVHMLPFSVSSGSQRYRGALSRPGAAPPGLVTPLSLRAAGSLVKCTSHCAPKPWDWGVTI